MTGFIVMKKPYPKNFNQWPPCMQERFLRYALGTVAGL